MFELENVMGGITGATKSISDAVVGVSGNIRTAFDAANGFFKPIGGGVAPAGMDDAGQATVISADDSVGFMARYQPAIIGGGIILALIVAVMIWRKRKKKG
jgi:hypothetical protein